MGQMMTFCWGWQWKGDSREPILPLVHPPPRSIHSHHPPVAHCFERSSHAHAFSPAARLPGWIWKSFLAGRRGRSPGDVIPGLCQQVGEGFGLGRAHRARIWGACS